MTDFDTNDVCAANYSDDIKVCAVSCEGIRRDILAIRPDLHNGNLTQVILKLWEIIKRIEQTPRGV